MAESSHETTPLLNPPDEANDPAPDVENAQPQSTTASPPSETSESRPVRSYYHSQIWFLTKLIFFSTIPTMIFIIPLHILFFAHLPSKPWKSLINDQSIDFTLNLVMTFSWLLLSLIYIAINARWNQVIYFPPFDLFFGCLLLFRDHNLAARYNLFVGSKLCVRYIGPDVLPPTSQCLVILIFIRIFLVLVVVGITVIGFSYLALFVFRTMAVFKSRFWRRSNRFSIPTGRISLEISINFWSQESLDRQGRQGGRG